MPFVLKVKYESTLRRMTVKEAKDGTPDLNFKELEAKIHRMFQIPTNNALVVTYMDQDKEEVTMGGDLDIHDACIVQRINPLRIEVKLQKTKPDGVDHKQVSQTKLLQSAPVVQLLVDSVNKSPFCYKGAALPKQLLSNNVESSSKVAEDTKAGVPYLTHKGIPFHKDVQCNGSSVERPSFNLLRAELDHSWDDQTRRNRFMLHEGKMARYFNNQSIALALKPPYSAKVPTRTLSIHKHASRFNVFRKGNFHSLKNLDARFVKHLTIPDGTEVFVGDHFTKSWRIRNTGSLPWPSATQLICAGGDAMGSQTPFTLKIPYLGLLPGKEIDASIDLVAPQRPGRFVSYWRVMAPTGQKFGHRIWVVIQAISKPQGCQQITAAGNSLVEQPQKQFVRMEERRLMAQSIGSDVDSPCLQSSKLVRNGEELRRLVRFSGSNLDSPASIVIHHGDDGAVPILLNVDGKAPASLPLSVKEDGHKTMGDPVLNLPHPAHTDAGHVTDLSLASSELNDFYCVEKPDVNFVARRDLSIEPPSPSPLVADCLNAEKSYKTIDTGLDKQIESVESAEDHDCQEDIILGMLNSMGFTQRALNLELLRKNKNDMQDTVDDLVVASEWDHILQELEELRFYDADMAS